MAPPLSLLPGIISTGITRHMLQQFAWRCCSPEAGDQRAAAEAGRRQPGGPGRLGGIPRPAPRRRHLPGLPGTGKPADSD